MPLRRILLAAVISCVLMQGPACSEIKTVAWSGLSDKDISHIGKAALFTDGEFWKHAESPHFIYHYTDEKSAEIIYACAEMYYGWIKNFFDIREDKWGKKNHLFIFADRGQWSKFLARIGHREDPGAFTNGWELFLYRRYALFSSRSSLAHELTHIIVFRFMDGPLPLFLNEGFATFAASCLIRMQLEHTEYRFPPVPFLNDKEYIPLDAISEMTSYPPGRSAVFYRESDWFIRFLAYTYGKTKCYDFLRAVSKSGDFKRSLKNIYDMDLQTIEEKFKAYAIYEL